MNRKNADDARRLGLPAARAHASEVLHRAEAERAEIAAREDTMDAPEPRTCSCGQVDCHRMWPPVNEPAPRASQADTGPHSTGCGSRGASDPDGGSAGHTEPRLREIFDDAFGEAPGGWEESVDAGIAAIRAAIADEIEAAAPECTAMDETTRILRTQGMHHAANLIRGGHQ